ncbi:DUF3310 domain-containing protein [Listeria phage LP-083-1]|uniref:DUF3310 domain-containing protein n=1 Tax=Listeria phage LP-083-1 TaxID=1458854 RepID=A0A059T5J6_9CAUD|nr:DUF3310 domain-containing protein [Listeria phage LP-083-1]
MHSVIQLYTFNDYVGYMMYMHKKGYKWADGVHLIPASHAQWNKHGHETYVREFPKTKEIRWVTSDYVELTPGTTVIPYIEKTDCVGTHYSIKRNLNAEMLTEKESRVIKKEAFDALVKPQHRMGDEISQPTHYTTGGIEPIKFIQSHNMNFEKGNVIKYVTRAGKKEGQNEVKDLKKARQYLDFLIKKLEGEEK